MKKIFGLGLLALGLAVMLSGCGKLPQADIDAATAAIDSAKMAGANVYIAEEFVAIEDSLKSAIEKIEQQKSKMFKNFAEPVKQLQEVKMLAAEATKKAATVKEQVKQEVQSALGEVTTMVAENKDLITKAPKGKEGKAALEAMQSELGVIETSVAEATTLFDSGEFMTAKEKIMAAKEKAVSINTELKDAIAKYTRK
ncbi:MAG: hypothetical protein JXB00_04090 [Bacteroidales bacterium]|nr:hypothetical protein [Bacteroidales bacterium]